MQILIQNPDGGDGAEWVIIEMQVQLRYCSEAIFCGYLFNFFFRVIWSPELVILRCKGSLLATCTTPIRRPS